MAKIGYLVLNVGKFGNFVELFVFEVDLFLLHLGTVVPGSDIGRHQSLNLVGHGVPGVVVCSL